ncbi:MAG: UDP-N-acetylmuramoyl-L-alanyl-D-glutamate--2,6-diaminopimelate ligase [Oscillospiraceae bacterium]|nr:UDP-N-acetylmuramoyl-L-alanyl-D-glutamate--2,6-diaminopimelate ligase [Oscillospiraceae bacterium]
MNLKKLLCAIDYTIIQGDFDVEISDIIYDSRKVEEGSLFVCLKGYNADGHKYAPEAASKGAAALLVSDDVDINNKNVTIIKVKNTREALAFVSAEFFSNPAKELTTIAITGTKGKTTTVAMIKSILECAGIKSGTIGTLGIIIGNRLIKTNNTTPESYEIQKAMREMVNDGCKAMIIEASSIGLKWHRVDAIDFDYGVFTNFSHDHIGGAEHKDMEEYLQCKAMLFNKCRVGIINRDDEKWEEIVKDATCKIETFGFDKKADLVASNDKLLSNPGFLGVHFDLNGKINTPVDVAIPGHFSVYNALSAIGVCVDMHIPKDNILEGLKKVKVKGRVEIVPVPGNYTLLIDYAHNALSMENVLTTLRQYNPNRLITMFGAGGNRPKVRRYEMGETSGRLSDLSVITEDNSRFEDVMDIIEDIKVGISKTNGEYVVVPNRKNAIKYCIENAQDGDIIVLAGKGHEDYQEIKGVKYHMDERELIAECLAELGIK